MSDGSYYKKCKYCGRRIQMRQMPAGQWVAFEGYDTVHDCSALGVRTVKQTSNSRPEWTSDNRKDPYADITFPEIQVGRPAKQDALQQPRSGQSRDSALPSNLSGNLSSGHSRPFSSSATQDSQPGRYQATEPPRVNNTAAKIQSLPQPQLPPWPDGDLPEPSSPGNDKRRQKQVVTLALMGLLCVVLVVNWPSIREIFAAFPVDTPKPTQSRPVTSVPEPTLMPTVAPAPPEPIIATANLNVWVYKSPDTGSDTIGNVPRGDNVMLIGRASSNILCNVRLNDGQAGWVYCAMLDTGEGFDSIPSIQ
jgi:hypothetical protein